MKKVILLIFLICINLLVFMNENLCLYAHEKMLNVEYDDCVSKEYQNSTNIGDGYNEKWYNLDDGRCARHIPHSDDDVTEIKYYFSPIGNNKYGDTWTTGISNEMSSKIIKGYKESMEKWNCVWFYLENESGVIKKKKIVNVIEGTADDYNLIIYPTRDFNYFAVTKPISDEVYIEEDNNVTHVHYSKWEMQVSISMMSELENNELIHILNRTGAHEIGHVLGLRDIDSIENSSESDYHHEELLMGYSKDLINMNRQCEITYKDIAGVAITRGYHDDSNHKWLYDRENSKENHYKLICSICNCVKYIDNLQEYNFLEYKLCEHDESNFNGEIDENMIPVARYDNTDYYKCKYCRYVAPFSKRIKHNYISYEEYNEDFHIAENSNNNLVYKIYEKHNYEIELGGEIYKCKDCSYSTIKGEYFLNANIGADSQNFILNNNEKAYFKINVLYQQNYEFKVSSDQNVEVTLYDDEFNEIECTDLDSSSNTVHIIKLLQNGEYYLRTKYENEESSGTINTKIVSRTNYNLTLGCNDILINTYNYNDDYNQSNIYEMFINNSKIGFYNIELIGIDLNGNEVICPSSSIIIKDSNQNIIDKFTYDEYSNKAINEGNENSFTIYLGSVGYIYVYIELETDLLNSLVLNFYPVDYQTIDIFEMLENNNTKINIMEDDSTYGDKFKKLYLNQSAKFKIEYSYEGNLNNEVLFVLSKLNYDNITDSYSLENIITEIISVNNITYTNTLNLSEGVYYVGYFNKSENSEISINFTRIVSEYSIDKLVADPDSASLFGSEVRFNNGSLRGNTLTVGFTRLLYLDYNLDVASLSILDFDLYVSDESVASVSTYGTLLARCEGEVTVLAVYKNDCSIIYSKLFTIIEDKRADDLVIEINNAITYVESGQLYQVELNDLNSPYPQNTLYSWTVTQSNYNTSISMYGSIRLSGEDYIIAEGRNKLNSKVVIRLILTVNLS